MITRPAHTDKTKNPPMLYLVADGCPRKWTTGDGFGSCVCGMTVPGALFPMVLAKCEHMRLEEVVTESTGQSVKCYHPELPPGPNGATFGIPTVAHAEDVNDGSDPD